MMSHEVPLHNVTQPSSVQHSSGVKFAARAAIQEEEAMELCGRPEEWEVAPTPHRGTCVAFATQECRLLPL